MHALSSALLLGGLGVALLGQEPERVRPAVPMRAAVAAPAAAPQGAELAREHGFSPAMLRYHSGDALPDFDLLAADGTTVAFSAARAKAPTIVVMAPSLADEPRLAGLKAGAKALADRYATYGVKTMFWGLWTSRAEFLAVAGEQAKQWPFAVYGDPVGPYVGEADLEAHLAHQRTTVLGRLFAGGMTTPLPASFVVDAEGKLAGSFAMRGDQPPFDGVANLLLRAGVPLAAADQPAKVAPAAAFAKAPPRPKEEPVELVKVGTKASDFPMVGVDGKPIRLADHAGKVVVLDFWATWCGPCKAAFPHVSELAQRYAGQGVVVIASCTNDSRRQFEQWVAEHGASYPGIVFACDPLERSPERASRQLYGVGGIPQQFVIGRDGKIASMVTGYMKGEVLLDAALAAAGIEVPAEVLEQAKQDLVRRDEMAKPRK